jgi:hypothetical protein
MLDDISEYFDLEAAAGEDEDASDCEYETIPVRPHST